MAEGELRQKGQSSHLRRDRSGDEESSDDNHTQERTRQGERRGKSEKRRHSGSVGEETQPQFAERQRFDKSAGGAIVASSHLFEDGEQPGHVGTETGRRLGGAAGNFPGPFPKAFSWLQDSYFDQKTLRRSMPPMRSMNTMNPLNPMNSFHPFLWNPCKEGEERGREPLYANAPQQKAGPWLHVPEACKDAASASLHAVDSQQCVEGRPRCRITAQHQAGTLTSQDVQNMSLAVMRPSTSHISPHDRNHDNDYDRELSYRAASAGRSPPPHHQWIVPQPYPPEQPHQPLQPHRSLQMKTLQRPPYGSVSLAHDFGSEDSRSGSDGSNDKENAQKTGRGGGGHRRKTHDAGGDAERDCCEAALWRGRSQGLLVSHQMQMARKDSPGLRPSPIIISNDSRGTVHGAFLSQPCQSPPPPPQPSAHFHSHTPHTHDPRSHAFTRPHASSRREAFHRRKDYRHDEKHDPSTYASGDSEAEGSHTELFSSSEKRGINHHLNAKPRRRTSHTNAHTHSHTQERTTRIARLAYVIVPIFKVPATLAVRAFQSLSWTSIAMLTALSTVVTGYSAAYALRRLSEYSAKCLARRVRCPPESTVPPHPLREKLLRLQNGWNEKAHRERANALPTGQYRASRDLRSPPFGDLQTYTALLKLFMHLPEHSA